MINIRRIFLLLIFSLIIVNCKEEDNCELVTSYGTYHLQYAESEIGYNTKDSGWEYKINICGNIKQKCKGGNYPSAVFYPDTDECDLYLGKFDSKFSMELITPSKPENGVRISYEDGEEVDYYGYKTKTKTQVDILCDEDIETHDEHNSRFKFLRKDYDGVMLYQFKMYSRFSCLDLLPTKKKNSFSLGSFFGFGFGGIFIILCIIGIILYFAIGISLCRFKFQKRGWEMIPFVNFWKQFFKDMWLGMKTVFEIVVKITKFLWKYSKRIIFYIKAKIDEKRGVAIPGGAYDDL